MVQFTSFTNDWGVLHYTNEYLVLYSLISGFLISSSHI
jgi:hypothetical protein